MRIVAVLVFLLAACGPKPPPKPAPDVTGDPVPTPTPTPTPTPVPRERAIETPALVAKPLPNDPLKATIHRLSNGMTVYISTDRQEPSIVAHVAVRAGSRHDPQNSTGLAHYLEHMLFKGTTTFGTLDYEKEKVHLDRIAQLYSELRTSSDSTRILKEIDRETQESAKYAVPNDFDNLYARMGIVGVNAFTDDDATVYIATIPKNRISHWARVEGSRYQDTVFRLFWPELEAVYEEKNRALDSPGRRVEEAFMLAMFPKHGYGYSSGIGEVEHLKKPAYADMVAFFNRYYTPGNMAILLSGDVDESVLPLLENEFAGFKRPAGEAVDHGQPAAIKGRMPLDVTVPSNEGVVLGWSLVAATHADHYPLEVMDLLLHDGKSGIIDRELLLPQKVASAASSPTFKREAGWFQLRADALAGQKHDDVEKLLLGLVGKLQRGEFTDADLATAILQYELRNERQIESNSGRLNLMEEAFITGEDWTSMVGRIDRMRKVTKADVVRVAKQYLNANFLAVRKVKGSFSPPKIDKPGITKVPIDPNRKSKFAQSVLEMPVTPIEPVAVKEGQDFERGTLVTGPLVAVKNSRNGLFSLTHEFQYGRVDDKLTCLAFEVMRVSGAGKRNSQELARALHELGITISPLCSKDEVDIVIAGPDKNLEAGLALLREWLAEPVFDDAILKARVAAALTERGNAMASPQAISGAAGQFARFGNDSELLVVATNKQLEAAKPDELKKILAKFLTMKHRTSYFGPRSGADAAKLITLGTGKTATRGPRAAKLRKPNTLLLVDQDTAQTHVWLLWPRKAANENERAVGALFSEYAAPLLYQEVREAQGLAYTVFGGYNPGARKIDDASVFAYVGTQGDKTHQSLDAVLATLRKDFDDNRLTIAKETLAQNHRTDRIAPRSIPGFVYALEDQGIKADPRADRAKRIADVTKADLAKWTKAAFAQPAIISITGNRKHLDDEKLQKLAPITVVPKDKLFGF